MILLKCEILALNIYLIKFECATIFEVIIFVFYLKVQSYLCRNNVTEYEDTLDTFALKAVGNRREASSFWFVARQHCTSCKYPTFVTFIK